MPARDPLLYLTVACLSLLTPNLSADQSAAGDIDLERIMADPEWVARSPSDPWISDDGDTVYFTQEQLGSDREELMQVSAGGGPIQQVPDDRLDDIGSGDGSFTRNRSHKVWTRGGDVFMRAMPDGRIEQLTRTVASESSPTFIDDDPARIAWRQGDGWFHLDRDTGTLTQLVALSTTDAPSDEEPDDYLHKQQLRLFETLRRDKANEDLEEERTDAIEAADESRALQPIHLGAGKRIVASSLSPAGDKLLVITMPEDSSGWKNDKMPVWVTRSGYVEVRDVRSRVGTGPLPEDELHVVDLTTGELHTLDRADLPKMDDDPLRHLRLAAAERAGEDPPKEPEVRPSRVWAMDWNPAGTEALLRIESSDNKDRWLATVDWESMELVSRFHHRDEAWIGYSFLDLGWMPSEPATFWHLSEESGYAHLYTHDVIEDEERQLTSGRFEIHDPVPTLDGESFYVRSNIEHPGRYAVYRVPVGGGVPAKVTEVGHIDAFRLSWDEDQLLLTVSDAAMPPELWMTDAQGQGPLKLTDTVTSEWATIDWIDPVLVEVPSSHTQKPIYARLYLPEGYDPAKEYPAVVFIHGAGYLQEAYDGWSYYFREFMFNTLLTRHGYVVIAPDFRASAGYGRDWRTAIYRQMGHPEVEDLIDTKAYLVDEHNVDPERVGVYGGSYGGFLTFMALFRAPGEFAAGASIRPVTDWASYNHGYTSNILNTPDIDPEAYEKSSPIEFAEGLEDRLLILHGLLDDNVFAQDSIRLQHRLIELKKEGYETVLYPREPHGFVTPEAWLDEYRRIFKLFEETLKEE